jgi:hypothetical protein
VSDIKQSLKFYDELFGQSSSKLRPGYLKYELESLGLIISFVENKELVKSNFGHLGIQVFSEEALKAYSSRIQKAGLKVREEIGTSCCYAVQDKFWVSSPDGVEWEIYLFKEDSLFNDPHYTQEGASACCSSSLEVAELKEENSCSEKVNTSSSCCETDTAGGCC